MTFKLSEGALEVIMSGGNYDAPVMQVLANKKLVSSSPVERYRLLISDGKYLNSFAMVATQLNDLVVNGELSEFTIIRINRYITTIFNNPDKDKRVMVILELDILKKGSEVGVRLGSPKNLDVGPRGVDNGGGNNPAPLPPPSASSNIKPAQPAQPAQSSRPTVNQNQIKTSQNSGPIHPISSLSPYQNKWSIKARVTNKQAPRSYTNAKGEGKLFSVVFTDESGEIKCTGFNNAVDKFADMLELNKVYIVSNCTIKPANKKFTQADYEMTFNNDSVITPCADDSNLPANVYNFTPISKIAELEPDTIIDVIGVAKSTSELVTLTARSTGKELKKRSVTLVESSRNSVVLTLWGQQAVDFDGSKCPVVAAKAAKVLEYMGGKSVSLLMSSTMQIDPDIPEAYQLRGWFDNGGSDLEYISVSNAEDAPRGNSANWVLFGDFGPLKIGQSEEKADIFNSVVTVLMVRHDSFTYKACPECKRKILDMHNGMYRCEKCNREFPNFLHRIILNMQVSDFTGSMWVSLFNDEAQRILGVDAESLVPRDDQDQAYKQSFSKINFNKYQMKLRCKTSTFHDEKRLKTSVITFEPVDYKAYARRLLNGIKEKAGIVSRPN